MLYLTVSKNLQLELKASANCAYELLKENTYPYCGDKKNYDFIGTITDNGFAVKIALSGPREIFRTVAEGNFRDTNDGKTEIVAKLRLSNETLSFILILNLVILLLAVCFAIFDVTKIFIPFVLLFVANVAFILAARSSFNTTIQLIEKALKI
ncbi:hypothetical protein [Ruminococcus sp.]|uniref:hypothetical protein n=1 Tax=Ruminococcus sp. TaxID=41978 RepID=UPI003EFC11C1